MLLLCGVERVGGLGNLPYYRRDGLAVAPCQDTSKQMGVQSNETQFPLSYEEVASEYQACRFDSAAVRGLLHGFTQLVISRVSQD